MRAQKHVRLIVLIWTLASVGCTLGPANPGASRETDREQPAGSAKALKRINAAMMSDPPTISSKYVLAGSGTIPGGDALEELLNAGLTHADDRGVRWPQLSEALPTVENGLWRIFPDGRMETIWTIRPGAQWHDGTPFTSADLVFTAALGQDKELPIFSGAEYSFLERVEGLDPHTVVIRWKRPYIRADMVFLQPRPRHVLEPAYQEQKMSVLQQPYWTDEYVGTGPFMLREWVRGSHLTMEASSRYVLGRPKVDEIRVKFIPDPHALMAHILAGEVELTLGRNLSLQQAMEVRDHWRDGRLELAFENWIALWPQLLGPQPPVLLQVPFRRALLHAIDRAQLVETLQYGLVPVAHGFVHPGEAVYPEIEGRIVRYEFEPRRSAQLIEELGYRRGADGAFADGAGQRLSLEVRTSGGDDTHEAGVFSIADSFKRVGVAADPFLVPAPQRDDRQYNSTYPGVRLWRLPNDIWGLDRYHSSAAPVPENRFNGGNRSRYMNPEFDALIDRHMMTFELGERVRLLGEIVYHMTDQVTVMGLWYNTQTVMVGRRLKNLTPKKTREANETWNAHEWEVKS